MAFWCWPAPDGKVVLTARCGPYAVFDLADFAAERPLALPPVPAFGKGRSARFSGIPRADGSLVLMTNRSERKAGVWDFADPENPKALRAYTLSGNPDLGAFFRGRAVIPAGHQGLVLER